MSVGKNSNNKNDKSTSSTNRMAGHIKDPGKIQRSDVRNDRLKRALRENLKRRKSQIKGRADVADAPEDDDAGSLDESSLDEKAEAGSGA